MQIHRCLCLFLVLSSGVAQELIELPPASEPAPIEAQPGSQVEQDRLLQELLNLYASDAITAGEYQRRRAQLLGRNTPQFDPWNRASVKSSNTRKPAAPDPAAIPSGAPARAEAIGLAVLESGSAVADAVASVAPAAGRHFQAAIVPGADLFVQIDMQAARRAPIYNTLRNLTQPGEAGPAAGLLENADRLERFQQHLGLTQDDLQRVIISADLDKLQLDGGPASMDAVPAMIGLQVAKDVNLAQVKEALVASMEGADEKVEVAEVKVGSADALVLRSQDPNDPRLHLAVAGGRTILVGLNRPSLSGAIDRAEGTPAPLSGSLLESQRTLPGTAQFKLGFVVPQSLRNTLAAMSAAPEGEGGAGGSGAGAMGPAAMLGGLKDLKSISLGVALAQGLRVQLSGDLGRPEAADGVNMLVQLMKPQLMAGLAEQMGKPQSQLSPDLISSSTKGSTIDISASLSKELVESLAAKQP